jgi:cytochrome P450
MAEKLAKRDSRRYEDPEKFNIHRGQHLASDVRQG